MAHVYVFVRVRVHATTWTSRQIRTLTSARVQFTRFVLHICFFLCALHFYSNVDIFFSPSLPSLFLHFFFMETCDNDALLMNWNTGITTVEPSLLTTCIPLGNYSAFAPTSGTNATTSADTLAGGFESAAGYAAYSTALSVTIAIGCSLLILNVNET